MSKRLLQKQNGVTLIELIVAMVIISIAVGGVLLVLNYTTRHSADPVLRHQAIAIAEAYMEEITLKSYSDPDGDETGESRSSYDDVDDYNGLDDHGAVDQSGVDVGGLGNYRVQVAVNTEDFGPDGEKVTGLKIDVTVTDPAGESFTLTGYRTSD